ncbi:serine hydrolase domain-containing protein [Actinomadura miaoliensis]|uniref:Serine hydrolase n=1 Tax=Actinomadura miaoliensis TaxID=430685 RepID=A0ABP7VUS3_9ACTN
MVNGGGLDGHRLARMRDVMAGHVEQGRVPGLVMAVWRRGEAHVETLGHPAFGTSAPLGRDALFRISSMTKPITAVAALILVEECRLRLDEPVDELLPELAGRRVLARPDGPLDDTVPAERPITVRDLLTFRLGMGMALDEAWWGTPYARAAQGLGIAGFGPPRPDVPHTADEWLSRLATLPLMYQPGERWLYNIGSLVLGVLVERVSGQPLETFLRERLFGPLGMKDTAFSVPAAGLHRLPTSYAVDPGGGLSVYDGVEDSAWSRPPAFADGAAGLVSTLDDFLAFARMLLDGGVYGGERILSRPAVELMTSDQLTPRQRAEAFGDAGSWGFGVSVVTRRDQLWATPGRYGWDGGLGTSWWSDPAENLIGVLLTQRLQFPAHNPVYLDFWTSVYQAVAD